MIKVNKWISEKEINGASLSYEIYLILYVIFQIMREREREREMMMLKVYYCVILKEYLHYYNEVIKLI